jgi:hypothetical protein
MHIIVVGDFNIANHQNPNGYILLQSYLRNTYLRLNLHLIIHNHICIITSNNIHINRLSLIPPLANTIQTLRDQSTEHFGYIYDLQIFLPSEKFDQKIINMNSVDMIKNMESSLLSNKDFWQRDNESFFGETFEIQEPRVLTQSKQSSNIEPNPNLFKPRKAIPDEHASQHFFKNTYTKNPVKNIQFFRQSVLPPVVLSPPAHPPSAKPEWRRRT